MNIRSCFTFFWYCVAIALIERFDSELADFHRVINSVTFFTQKNVLILHPGNGVHHLHLLQHCQLWVLAWVTWESMLGLSPRLSVIFNSLALCFWQLQQHQWCLCQSFVFRLKFFASAKSSLKRAQRNNIFAPTNFGCFSSSAALAFALTFTEKTFCKFWLFKQNFSKIQPIAHILWSIQRVPVAFTGRTPALYIRTFSSSLLRAIIARNHLLFFKIISNFEHFCPNF